MRQQADKEKGKGKSVAKGKDIVRRELKGVITSGTQTENLTEELSKHCLAIVVSLHSRSDADVEADNAQEHLEDGDDRPVIGVCVLDASTASFSLAHFVDDASRTKLDTLIRQCRATELVHVKNRLSAPTIRVLRAALLTDCQWVPSKSVEPSASIDQLKTLLANATEQDADDEEMQVDGDGELPKAVEQLKERTEVIAALGSMLAYLKEVNLDSELVTARRFRVYDPMRDGQRLVLDGQTLAHIEVLQNRCVGRVCTRTTLSQVLPTVMEVKRAHCCAC